MAKTKDKSLENFRRKTSKTHWGCSTILALALGAVSWYSYDRISYQFSEDKVLDKEAVSILPDSRFDITHYNIDGKKIYVGMETYTCHGAHNDFCGGWSLELEVNEKLKLCSERWGKFSAESYDNFKFQNWDSFLGDGPADDIRNLDHFEIKLLNGWKKYDSSHPEFSKMQELYRDLIKKVATEKKRIEEKSENTVEGLLKK